MKKTITSAACFKIAVIMQFLFLSLAAISPAQAEFFRWRHSSPESEGLDSMKLAVMGEELAARGTKAVLVIRNDRIVYEWYAQGHGVEKKHYTASLAKGLVGGMSLLVAMNDRRIGADDLAWKYIPAWRNSPLRRNITIRNLATHSSGIEDAQTTGENQYEQSGWKYFFWKRAPDPFSMAIYEAPVVCSPGEKYIYSNPGMAALAYAVTASYKDTVPDNIRTLLKERVMDPIGVPENEWSVGYGATYELDGLSLCANWGGGSYTARAVARVGRLLLRKGLWEGTRLVDSTLVEQMVSYANTPVPDRSSDDAKPASGLGCYTNYDGVWAHVPRDAFAAAGAGNQVLLVVPSLEMIVVRNGSMLDTTSQNPKFWGGVEEHLFNPVMDALLHTPQSRSEVIRDIEFEPVEKIVRLAVDSDNWPITWGDDGDMYTAYGDGWGFEPRTEKKLSNGLAKIIGPAENFRCENIRSPEGESVGGGRNGSKASGMLMVDGTLYMWMRNLDNSQLWWSENRGLNWSYGFKFRTSFGCPAILNFGRNYQGARDGYVYIYSHDGPSAYENYDRVVLARAPKERLRDREAYEFFKGLDSGGNPLWSADIDERAGVFSQPGGCHRTDVVYNPGLGRYMMALAFNHSGAWGILEAPEPWGPWKVAFYTEDWGLGNTHGYRIPSKWIAPDGKSFYLVFSGRSYKDTTYDAFCVRRARIITAD